MQFRFALMLLVMVAIIAAGHVYLYRRLVRDTTHDRRLRWAGMILFARDYSAGLYRNGDAHIYVSRGCGFWGPPMRVGSPPELVKVILTPA